MDEERKTESKQLLLNGCMWLLFLHRYYDNYHYHWISHFLCVPSIQWHIYNNNIWHVSSNETIAILNLINGNLCHDMKKHYEILSHVETQSTYIAKYRKARNERNKRNNTHTHSLTHEKHEEKHHTLTAQLWAKHFGHKSFHSFHVNRANEHKYHRTATQIAKVHSEIVQKQNEVSEEYHAIITWKSETERKKGSKSERNSCC